MPDLISITCPSLQIFGKTQTGTSNFRISGQFLIKENCHNFRTSDDIHMKLRPVTKIDKRNKTTPKKKLAMTSCQKIVTPLSFFGFMANLEQSGGLITDTKSAKVTFPLIVTFCLGKNENRTIESLTQLSHYCFE